MVSQNSPAALQRQMRSIRGNLFEHADKAGKKARMEFDWRHYVARHPWASLGTAVAVGYFLVPRRACCQAGDVHKERAVPLAHTSPLSGIANGVWGAVTAAIAREGAAFATSFIRDFFTPRDEKQSTSPAERMDEGDEVPGHADMSRHGRGAVG